MYELKSYLLCQVELAALLHDIGMLCMVFRFHSKGIHFLCDFSTFWRIYCCIFEVIVLINVARKMIRRFKLLVNSSVKKEGEEADGNDL